MKKVIALMFILAFMTGCAKSENSSSSITDIVGINTTEFITEPTEPTLTFTEKELGITIEKKAEFIDKFSNESYDTAMASVPIYLQLYSNSNSKISESQITKYRENYTVETFEITSSFDGHTIPADYIYDKEKDRDTIITVHGSGENRRFKEIEMYLEMGYNIISFDQRSSGDNFAELATFGVLEHYDLLDIINYADSQISSNQKLIVYGKSMGGATVGIALGSDNANEKVDFAILDCPSGSMRSMIENGMENYCSPDEFDDVFNAGDEFMSYFYGFTINDGEVSERIKTTTVPVLIFASTADKTVDFNKIESVYNSISAPKYMYISETAGHCGIYFTESEEYSETVKKFLNGDLF